MDSCALTVAVSAADTLPPGEAITDSEPLLSPVAVPAAAV
jgi:hypothetical protein